MKNSLNLTAKSNSFIFYFFTVSLFGIYLISFSIFNILSLKYESEIKTNKIIQYSKEINIHKDFYKYIIFDKIKKNDQIASNFSTNLNVPNLKLFKNEKNKKEKFIATILPYIIKKNEEIFQNRKELLKIKTNLIEKKTLDKDDQIILKKLAVEYKIKTHNTHKIDIIENLLKKVDTIPNSIVLAQAANESGWGKSRFAKFYNAFFGEYTFDKENGVVPAYRDKDDKHFIKFFSTINESVSSYFSNINTHSAYNGFRKARAQYRYNGKNFDSINLLIYLKPYAKDENYIKNLKSIIKTNKLLKFDNIKSITTKS